MKEIENLEIRELKKTDYRIVIELWKKTENLGLNESDSENNYKKYLERNPGMSFTAVMQNKVVGTVLCGHDGRRGYIYHMAVEKSFRKSGIGKRLLDRSLKKLSEEGITRCHIFVFKENKAGFSFWEKSGFKRRKDIIAMTKYFE